jgi:hypothetical protein
MNLRGKIAEKGEKGYHRQPANLSMMTEKEVYPDEQTGHY